MEVDNNCLASLSIAKGLYDKPKPKDMIKFFFSPCEDKDYHVCKKCKSKFKQKQNTGFSNLKNHLISCVGKNFQENYEETAVSNIALGRLESFG